LCLTVSNEEEDCVSTSCQLLEIDSLGWINGFMDGFSITIMNGEDGVVNGIDEQPANELGFNVMPNPVVNGSFGLNWEASSSGLVEYHHALNGWISGCTNNSKPRRDQQCAKHQCCSPGAWFVPLPGSTERLYSHGESRDSIMPGKGSILTHFCFGLKSRRPNACGISSYWLRTLFDFK